MSTATRLMTADEFWMTQIEPGTRHELIRGEVRRLDVPGAEHGEVAAETLWQIMNVVKARRLGKVFAAETGCVLEHGPDTVRAPDVAFVRSDRMTEIVQREKFLPFAPDLAVEVASPTDRPAEIAEKTEFWLASGTRMVWNLYPKTTTATVHLPQAPVLRLNADDMLDGGDVLPGFLCRVGDLFA